MPRKDPKPFKVWFLWSEESVRKYQETGVITRNDLKMYEFETPDLLNAFLEGVDAACGWLESEQFDENPLARKAKDEPVGAGPDFKGEQ